MAIEMGFSILSLFVMSLLCVTFSESAGLYVTTVMKNTYGILPNHAENFAIPDGQCSGFIDRSLLCFNQDTGVVQIQVKDNVAYPNVHIDNSLHSATIQRVSGPGGRCAGEAELQLSYYCLQDQGPIRQRRSLRLLPLAPTN